MSVVDPLKLVIDNYPEDKTDILEVEYHPDHPEYGSRKIPFTKELWIEKGDFMVEPIKKYKRLYPGNEVRLYKGYYVTCTGYDTDENGEVTCVHCTVATPPTEERCAAQFIGFPRQTMLKRLSECMTDFLMLKTRATRKASARLRIISTPILS